MAGERVLKSSPGMLPLFARAGATMIPGASKLPFLGGGDASGELPDDFGVVYHNVFFTEDGHQFCVMDAANINAVVGSHKALGMPVQASDVHPIWIGSLSTT